MAQQTRLAKRSEKGLLTLDNCVVTLIDLQPQMLFGVSNFDRQSVINNNLVLAKAAKVFRVPVVLSTVEAKSFSGNMWPQILAVFPHQEPITRSGARRTTSEGSATMRPLARDCFASSAKQSSPPAISISSETQAMALIIGSSHSSK